MKDEHTVPRYDLLRHEGFQQTDLYCHACQKNFRAKLDYSLDGNHEIECPHCGHKHYRKIKSGVVTGERYDSDSNTHVVPRRSVWKSTTQPMVTNSASAHLRDAWLRRYS